MFLLGLTIFMLYTNNLDKLFNSKSVINTNKFDQYIDYYLNIENF